MSDTRKVVATLVVAPIVTSIVVVGLDLIAGEPIGAGWALLAAMGFGLLYGLMAGLLRSYNLSKHGHIGLLVLDLTWSLPNTIAGFIIANPLYIFFGNPSRSQSEGETWISYKARGSSGFGTDVLQTFGTVNLGGAGNHEKVHLLQARIFGPLFLPFGLANYVLTALVQILFTISIGAILVAAKSRDKAYFQPPASSAVSGFFGWIYYATVFELWAYATE